MKTLLVSSMDTIEEIVHKAIRYTEDILSRAPRHRRIAREELERMRDNLEIDATGHPALQRLEDYLHELDRRLATEDVDRWRWPVRMNGTEDRR